MDVRELQIGDWVYFGEKSQFPMQITGIFQDSKNGTVYLDFEGNEGDVFEAEVENVAPIPITAELLEKNGFEKHSWDVGCDYNTESIYWSSDGAISLEKKIGRDYIILRLWSLDCRGINVRYIHQLQNAMRLCGIEWEVKI